MNSDQTDFQAMSDIADAQIVSSEGEPLGRVADVVLSIDEAGTYRCVAIVMGPEALAGRLGNRLRSWLHRLLKGRFDYEIDIGEVAEFGSTLTLRHPASHYRVGHADQWAIDHVLRRIPGNGRAS